MYQADKMKWAPGPWTNEPDEASWTDEATGYACEARRNHSGAWCGYVRIPQDHPLHGIEYSQDLPERLHGAMEAAKEGVVGKRGVMEVFSMALRPDSNRVNYLFDVHGSLTYSGTDWPAPGFWYGFDCSHCDDLSPAFQTRAEYGDNKGYRDLPYVKAECASLARQLQALMVPSRHSRGPHHSAIRRTTMRKVGSIAIAGAVPLIFWLGGYDFDHRGAHAVFCMLITAFVYAAAITCPFWDETR